MSNSNKSLGACDVKLQLGHPVGIQRGVLDVRAVFALEAGPEALRSSLASLLTDITRDQLPRVTDIVRVVEEMLRSGSPLHVVYSREDVYASVMEAGIATVTVQVASVLMAAFFPDSQMTDEDAVEGKDSGPEENET